MKDAAVVSSATEGRVTSGGRNGDGRGIGREAIQDLGRRQQRRHCGQFAMRGARGRTTMTMIGSFILFVGTSNLIGLSSWQGGKGGVEGLSLWQQCPPSARGRGGIGAATHLPPTAREQRRTMTSRLQAVTAPTATDDTEASIPTTPTAPSSSSSGKLTNFESFDYRGHWYPVTWVVDMPKLNHPYKVTIFDIDYVVARTSESEVIALEDVCPHKLAALSEGRVTKNGQFQCAYHGWTFDGSSGKCVQIPQVVDFRTSQRTNARAVPAAIVQGMVWLFPHASSDGGGLLEEALQTEIPRVPEFDMDGYKTVRVVRDFPIDWSILLENIMDPDHGLFAHQMPGFDFYSASNEQPQGVTEDVTHDGKGWTITSTVNAVFKLKERDGMLRNQLKGKKSPKKKQKSKSDPPPPKKSTTTFVAPSLVYMGRRDAKTDETGFVNGFWVCPVGTGRSRFMSASAAKAPFTIPRWLQHVVLNNFLDQDTYLLATQQRQVLAKEMDAVADMEWSDGDIGSGKTASNSSPQLLSVRKRCYAYRTPTERLGVRLGAFFDATLGKAPNRWKVLRRMSSGAAAEDGGVPPTRRVVLDRYVQHTSVCSDSADVVRNCDRARRFSLAVSALTILARALAATTSSGLVAASTEGVAGGASRSTVVVGRLVMKLVSGMTNRRAVKILALSYVVSYLASKLKREFFFKYEEQYRDRDMDKIPGVWLDEHVRG